MNYFYQGFRENFPMGDVQEISIASNIEPRTLVWGFYIWGDFV